MHEVDCPICGWTSRSRSESELRRRLRVHRAKMHPSSAVKPSEAPDRPFDLWKP